MIEIVYFYSPHTKSVVKLIAKLSKVVTDWAIPDEIEMELIKYGHKAPVVQAPVYEDGDWWVFRVNMDEKPPIEYRITYQDGEFQGDDPLILTDNPPLASVYSNHPDIKNFNFPLFPGKKWKFRYSRAEYGFPVTRFGGLSSEIFGNAEVEVMGPLAETVETPAGKFEVVEIRRNTFSHISWAGADPPIEIVYFYSPGTKSVVRLIAKISKVATDVTIPDHIKMELIKYGRGATISGQPVVKAPIIK